MHRLLNAYRFLNITSIDVAAGAVICACFFSEIMNVSVRPSAFIALGLTVWIIYTLDHLLDAKRLTSTASTLRHQFHQRHFKTLSILVVIAALTDLVAVLLIRKPLLIAGLILSVFIVIYLLVQRYLSLYKEFWGGILYTMGVTLPAFIFGYNDIQFSVVLLVIQFLFTTWINLLLFSLFDKERDEADNHISFATQMGESKTKNMIVTLFFICVVLGFYQLMNDAWYAGLIVLLMDILLILVLAKKEKFAAKDRFRLLGDAVFLLPVFYLLS